MYLLGVCIMSGARRRNQFSIAGLLALTAMLALSLGSVRYALGNGSPESSAIALVLGLIGLGATLGWGVGYLVRGPAGAAWGAWIGAFLVVLVPFVLALIGFASSGW